MNKDTRKTISILRKARALWDKKRWIQHQSAVTSDGYSTVPDCEAAGFCASGVIRAVEAHAGPVYDAEQALYGCVSRTRNYPSLPFWNDAPRRTKKQVLALFDRTIAKLEKEV